MPVEIIGMIGVKPEGADGAAVHVIGGAVDTLDRVTNGRVALHIITGGSDIEQTRDGDWLDHDTRYRRTDEYLHVLRRMWTSAAPFDHEGEFYRFAGAFSEVKPLQPGGIPLDFGGASGPAATVAAKHCDVYALWGEPLAAVKQRIADVHEKAAAFGRRPRISVSMRPIIAPTAAHAWDRARRILATVLIRGFDPLHDALEYGRELIPLVRAEVARRDRDAAELV